MQNNLYAQEIILFWTKASRGAPLSVVRNKCAKAFVLSEQELSQLINTDCHSRVRMDESQSFSPYQTIETDGFDSSISAKFLNSDADHNTITVKYEFSRFGGAPDRSHRPPISYTLTPDKLLRIQFNQRHSWPAGGWQYQLTVFNLLLTNQPSLTMFMTEPVKTISDLEDLW